MNLSSDAYNALNTISSKTKADCWFWLQRRYDGDMIFDLENERYLDWAEGLIQLREAIVDPLSEYGLSDAEEKALVALYNSFGISL